MCYAPKSPPDVTWVQSAYRLRAHAIQHDRTNEARTQTLCGRTPPDGTLWQTRTTFPIGPICTLCRWSYSARSGFDIEETTWTPE